ncbi:MAG: single-stranded-DNA-specific exonuclease RecJ [Pseudomonadota bacterium]
MAALATTTPTGAMTEDAPYLGVTCSVRGMAWRARLAPSQEHIAAAIAQTHGLPELLGRTLAARGVSLDDVPDFLEPSIKALMPDPSIMVDMDKAAARLADAIETAEPVAIFGDYDVDGGASTALMQRFLAAHGQTGRLYIPDRLLEGYGPNAPAITQLIENGAKLIVTVDCGTTSFEPLQAAQGTGCDVIVVDHHQADERLPAAHAVVNPNRQDDLSGLGHLCAAGVVFMLLVATTRTLRTRGFYADKRAAPNLMAMLDLVALATVCDVVPLEGLNRAFVVRGLQVMRERDNRGLRALFECTGLNAVPTPYHLGFVLGPRINAGGRIGEATLGARLLSTQDPGEAARIASTLDRLNKERKALETRMLEEAMANAEALVEAQPETPVIMVGSEAWHKGVVGLVASRLTERFHRPSCVIAWESADRGTGSLRSVDGVDIGGAVRDAMAQGLLIKGGGHAMAAGLTVARSQFEPLREHFAHELTLAAREARARAVFHIDASLTPKAATHRVVELLERAGPYGQNNPQPRFAFPHHTLRYAKIVGENHVRCSLQGPDGSKLDAIAFRASGQPIGEALLNAGGRPLHIAGTLKPNDFNGQRKIDLFIDDVAEPGKV